MDNQFVAVKQAMVELLDQMRLVKPTDRSETARRVAVAITEQEKVLSYWASFVVSDEFNTKPVEVSK
jgi:hypothetical protein